MITIDKSRINKHRVVFLTGTRADYGKLKSLIRVLSGHKDFDVHIFATGMHMQAKYGSTYKEIVKDGFPNIYTYVNQNKNTTMDISLSNTITGFSNYINELMPDAIVVHGDRLEALAGAIVGAFNNIRVFHIEGGEVSGTIDESIRHAVSKFSHFHFVSNQEAKRRIIQLGEPDDHIFIFGSPDIDIMYSNTLPTIETVKEYYNIPFDHFNIVLYHPVTTEISTTSQKARALVNTIVKSNDNFVVIYPNNDSGSELILQEYHKLTGLKNICIFPSMRFEYFLTLLKNADCLIGNSSSGIRETCIYGIPTIDLGNRQLGRYNPSHFPHIVHIEEDHLSLDTIESVKKFELTPSSNFGNGNSEAIFLDILSKPDIWNADIQKHFIDVDY